MTPMPQAKNPSDHWHWKTRSNLLTAILLVILLLQIAVLLAVRPGAHAVRCRDEVEFRWAKILTWTPTFHVRQSQPVLIEENHHALFT